MFDVKTPANYEQKCLCVLLLDTSYSMLGKPLSELQKGIKVFHQEIAEDPTTANRLEIAIITYNSDIEVIQHPALVGEFEMPELEVNGSTHMGEAIDEAINLVEARKSWYKQTGQPYYRPWIITITDGEASDIPSFEDVRQKIQSHIDEKNFFFFGIGVENANMKKLQAISSKQMPPAKLKGLKFAEFFTWLSASMTQVTSSADGDKINLPSPADWMDGFTIQ